MYRCLNKNKIMQQQHQQKQQQQYRYQQLHQTQQPVVPPNPTPPVSQPSIMTQNGRDQRVIKLEPSVSGSVVINGNNSSAFSENSILARHLGMIVSKSPSDPQERTFSGTMCSAKLKNKRNFETHMKRHRGELPFKCEECPNLPIRYCQAQFQPHLKAGLRCFTSKWIIAQLPSITNKLKLTKLGNSPAPVCYFHIKYQTKDRVIPYLKITVHVSRDNTCIPTPKCT